MWLRIPDPSKGAPTKSSLPLSLSAPRPAGVVLNSEPARTGEGAEICRSSEELEEEEGVCLELEMDEAYVGDEFFLEWLDGAWNRLFTGAEGLRWRLPVLLLLCRE